MSDPAAPAPQPAPEPIPVPQPQAEASSPTTASMLAYAFAHKIAPPPPRLMPSKPVPCAGADVKVSRDELAVILIHVAFWDLQRNGRIRFEEVEKKVLFVKQRQLKVRVMAGAAPEQEIAKSLEYELLRAAIAANGDGDVRDAVRWLYQRDVEEPYRRAIAFANTAMIAAGLIRLDVEDRGRLHGGRQETLMWQCDRVYALTPAFNAFAHEWVRDREANGPFYERIHKEVDRAISSRKKEERESLLETLSDD